MVVLTAPSGTGKTTVAERVLAAVPRLAFSVSHTTRAPRSGEAEGRDYHFVDDATFDQMIADNAFAEHARVHARRYGTSHAEIERLWAQGRDILFDIDPQGGFQLMRAYPEAVTIFMLPPSMDALEARLRGRSTETEEQVQIRLANARAEIACAPRYHYVIVNDDVVAAAETFQAILVAERARTTRHAATLDSLLRGRRDA
ncbi:MAG: guanylate kinase [Deltaproteobacteria bacterium]|nr:guanylate kinase [Deltaproteobacteria bacterium]MCB9787316.1 guanylate kinase [Deltaproteobacteria bacterium]